MEKDHVNKAMRLIQTTKNMTVFFSSSMEKDRGRGLECIKFIRTPWFLRKRTSKVIFHFLHLLLKLRIALKKLKRVRYF